MADNHSQNPSTVAPGDSASSISKKRKPGKAERAARRSQVGSSAGQQASVSKASAFASGMNVPVPQPGRYPVVFQTGAGEPSRDAEFSLDGPSIESSLNSFPSRFDTNPKYAEFKAHSEIDDDDFQKHLIVSGLLRLSQQIVHAHVNMGLPQGDFAPVASSDVRVPASMAAYIGQLGEFSVPSLGTRYLLSGYTETVRRLIWMAEEANRIGPSKPLSRYWLPMSAKDPVTRTILAAHLEKLLLPTEVSVKTETIEGGILSGTVPDAWESIKGVLGNPPSPGRPDRRDRFDFLFKAYDDVGQFTSAFSSTAATQALAELGVVWSQPSAGHMNWQFNAKEAFTRLADNWAKLSTSYAQFFEMSAGQSVRAAATGSIAQMAIVKSVEQVTVVKTHLALSAPEFSLSACFPPTAVFSGDLDRRVVVTTPLSVRQRATEFCQLDWR